MEEFQNFKIINSQLKKKFVIRKPDLNETKEQFNELSKELKSFKSYSGILIVNFSPNYHVYIYDN